MDKGRFQILPFNGLKRQGLRKKMKKNVEEAVELNPANIEARFSLINFYLQAPGFMGGRKDKAKLQAEEIKKVIRMKKPRQLISLSWPLVPK